MPSLERDILFNLLMKTDQLEQSSRRASRKLDELEGAGRKSQKRLDGFVTIGKRVGGAIAAMGIADAAFDATLLAASADEAASKFNTVFGPAVGDVSEFLDGFARMSGLARHEAEDLTGTVGNIVQGLGAGQNEAAAFSQELLTLAGDLASFNDRTTQDAAEALTSALTGERERLKGFGIIVREAEVQARALANTGKETAAELTNMEKAAATLELAMERSGKAIGDNERTADSAARQYKSMQAAIKDAQVEIGRALLPVLEAAIPLMVSAAEGAASLVNELVKIGDFFAGVTRPPKPLLDFFELLGGGRNAPLLEPGEDFSFFGQFNMNDMERDADAVFNAVANNLQRRSNTIANNLQRGVKDVRPFEGVEESAEAAETAINDIDLSPAEKAFADFKRRTAEAMTEAAREVRESAQRIINPFEEMPDQIQVTVEEFLQRVNDQVAAAQRFEEVMAEFTRRGLVALRDVFVEEGPLATDAAEDLLGNLNAAWEAELKLREFVDNELAGLFSDQTPLTRAEEFGEQLNRRLSLGFGSPNLNVSFPDNAGIGGDPTTRIGANLRFAQGGVVPGPLGAPQLVLAHGGEEIIPAHRRGGGTTINVNVAGSVVTERQLDQVVAEAVARANRRNLN